jgi:hypothetical protein
MIRMFHEDVHCDRLPIDLHSFQIRSDAHERVCSSRIEQERARIAAQVKALPEINGNRAVWLSQPVSAAEAARRRVGAKESFDMALVYIGCLRS